jgi:ABC-type lipoprotein export system ATPase subunit
MQGIVPVHALRGISFSLEKDDFVAILEPFKSGKSTLLYLVRAIDRLTEGSVGQGYGRI